MTPKMILNILSVLPTLHFIIYIHPFILAVNVGDHIGPPRPTGDSFCRSRCIVIFSGLPIATGLSRLMVRHEPHRKISSRSGRVMHSLPLFKLKGLTLAFVDADATPDTHLLVKHRGHPLFVCCIGMILQAQGLHGTALDAQSTAQTNPRIGAGAVVGGGEAARMLHLEKSGEPHAAARIAVADRVNTFLLIGDAVDQARLGALFEDLLRLLPRNLAAEAVIHNVMTELIKMQADLCGIRAIRLVWIEILDVFTGADSHDKIIERIK